MRDDGMGMLIEVTSDYEIALTITGLTGRNVHVEDGRVYGAFLTHEKIIHLIKENGFKLCNYQVQIIWNTQN